MLIDENRQLRKDLQEQETEMFKVGQILKLLHAHQNTAHSNL